MAWRIHLTNQAIQTLHILNSRPSVLVAWTNPERVHFYDLQTGKLLREKQFTVPAFQMESDPWQEFLGSLTGPDDRTYMPFCRVKRSNVYLTDDGKLRLYRLSDQELLLEVNAEVFRLPLQGAERVVAVDLDRALGMVAALDERCRLHLFQQNVRLGTFDLGLQADPDLRPRIVISRGGGSIFATDGHHIVHADSSGQVQKRIETHYYISRLACSPNGAIVVSSDIESGVLRIYQGTDLAISHQRFAIDLVAQATQIQLLADMPPIGTAISSMAVNNEGVLAFAMSGVVCVTDQSFMDELPRPRTLL